MSADTSEVLGAIIVFAFVAFTIGVVLYAIVRPFTHIHHHHEAGLWNHLP